MFIIMIREDRFMLGPVTKTIFRTVILSVGLALFITACAAINLQNNKELLFSKMYPDVSMKGFLKLGLFETYNDGSFFIILEDISNHVIRFEGYDEHDIYQYDEEKEDWIRVKEKIVTDNNGPFLLYPEDHPELDQPKLTGHTIYPDIGEFDRKGTVRVVYVGEIMENGKPTGKKVGAYMDIGYSGKK